MKPHSRARGMRDCRARIARRSSTSSLVTDRVRVSRYSRRASPMISSTATSAPDDDIPIAVPKSSFAHPQLELSHMLGKNALKNLQPASSVAHLQLEISDRPELEMAIGYHEDGGKYYSSNECSNFEKFH
eukprot:8494003-Pyramimonas_sp.AAC.1